jgi:hypothetical protein
MQQEDFRRAVEAKDVNVIAIADTSFDDILGFIRAHVVWLAVALVIGGVIGAIFGIAKPKQWEASALLQVGQIGSVDSGTVSMIEPVPNAVERINGLIKQGAENDAQALSPQQRRLLTSSFSAQAVAGTSFLRMTARGFSPDEAKATVTLAEDRLIATHTKMMAPALEHLHRALAEVAVQSGSVEKRKNALMGQLEASIGKPAGVQDVMLNALADKVEEEARVLQARRSTLEQQLSDQQSFPTRLIGGVVVSNHPVAPNVPIFVIAGCLIGFIIGVGVCFVLDRSKAFPNGRTH